MTRVRLAWLLASLSVLCAVGDTAITLATQPFLSEQIVGQHGWPFVTLAAVACGAMGALIVSRYPRHRIGWLLTTTGIVSAVSLMFEAWSIWIVRADGLGSLHTGHLLGWFSALLGAPPAIAMISLVILTAPDGRLLSPPWRWAGIATVVGLSLYTAGVLTIPPGQFLVDRNQDFGWLTSVLNSTGIIVLSLGLIASVVSLVRRQRRSAGELRQQLRWITVAAMAIPIALVWLLVAQTVRGVEQDWVDSLPLFLSYLAFPVSVAIAVLRHRLYDVDLIVSRAALLATATAFVAAGYVVLVVVIGGNANGFWPSLLATAVVALAFQPLRSRAVRLADRLAYGRRAAPYEALAEFTRRLGESPDPTTLLVVVAHSAAAAVNASRVTVELSVTGGPPRTGSWPAEFADPNAAPSLELPVTDRGEALGRLVVDMPPGLTLRERDLQLLTAIADQAAIAFRGNRLTAELTARVQQLRVRTTDLAESRRRLITAGDAERRRVELAIGREVMPHLEPLPAALGGLVATWSGDPVRLEPALTATSSALEALREITRGVFPAQLERSGLCSALASYLGREASKGQLRLDGVAADQRFHPRVEAAAYFCVTEAGQGLQARLHVGVSATPDELAVRVTGRQQSPLAMADIRDRVEAAGGTVTSELSAGQLQLDVRLPVGSEGRRRDDGVGRADEEMPAIVARRDGRQSEPVEEAASQTS
jgi:GAF domain-containing protein